MSSLQPVGSRRALARASRLVRAGARRGAALARGRARLAAVDGAGRRWSAGWCWRRSAGLIVDLPAAAFGVEHHLARTFPPGLAIADTVVQDVGFVLAAVLFARIGGRVVRSWQFGLRPPRMRLARGAAADRAAARRVHRAAARSGRRSSIPKKRSCSKQLGSNEGTALLAAERRADVRGGADLRGVPVPRLHLHGAAQLAGDVAGGDHHRPAVRRRARRLGAGARPRAARRRSASACACSTATRARCIRASSRTR